MSKRILPGIAAATVGAGVMVLALVGIGGSALAESNPATPRPHTCVEAIDAWHKTQDKAKDKDGPGFVHDGRIVTKAEQDRINDAKHDATKDNSPGGKDITEAEQHRIDAAENAAKNPKSPGEKHDGREITKAEQDQINYRKAAADKACQGPAGQPGKDGAPGTPAPATPPVNQPQASGGNVIITTTVPDNSRDVGEAPAPQTVTSDLPVTH